LALQYTSVNCIFVLSFLAGARALVLRGLSPPLVLKDGRELTTLFDARDFILSLPTDRQREPHWISAGDFLLEAAYGDEEAAVRARTQLSRALCAEGLLFDTRVLAENSSDT
jgi:hypothetical protein